MNLRHAAVLASIGWYLMVPESSRRMPLLLETNESLSQWETRQSFDTAQECKAAQHKIHTYLEAATSRRLKEDGSQKAYVGDPVSQMLWAEEAKIAASKCIATDDPRLKGN
jgi:histidinol phosphatase-like enzyme